MSPALQEVLERREEQLADQIALLAAIIAAGRLVNDVSFGKVEAVRCVEIAQDILKAAGKAVCEETK